jgi:hypothetical protein
VTAADRAKTLQRVGPICISQLGTLGADTEKLYETRVDGILRLLVEGLNLIELYQVIVSTTGWLQIWCSRMDRSM